jgi:hypothetical protein
MSTCRPAADLHSPTSPEPEAQPCAHALVAATVALMTTWADPNPSCKLGPEAQRQLIARKLVAQLHLLRGHPALPQPLRLVMAHAHARWLALAAADGPALQVAGDSPAQPLQASTLH